jgi:hypothetical protein
MTEESCGFVILSVSEESIPLRERSGEIRDPSLTLRMTGEPGFFWLQIGVSIFITAPLHVNRIAV